MSKSLYKFTDGFGEIENSKDVALAKNLLAVCEKQQEYYDYCYSLPFYTDICNALKETMKEYGSEKNKQTTDGLDVYDYDLKVFLEESTNNILEMAFEKSRKLDRERQQLQPEYPGSSTIFAQAVFDAVDTVSQMFARFAELNDSLDVSRAICKSEHDPSFLLRVIESHYSKNWVCSYGFGEKTMEYSKIYKLLTIGRSNYYSHLPLNNHAFLIGIAENLKSRGYQFNPEIHGKHFSLGKNTFISPLIFSECKRSDLEHGVSTLEHRDRFRPYAPLVRARFKDDDYGLKAKIVFNNKNSSDFMNLEAEEFFCMIGSQNKYVQKAMNDAYKKHYASYDSCYRVEEYVKDIQLTVKLNKNDKLLKDMILSSSEKNCDFKNVVYRLMVVPLFMSKDVDQVIVETDTFISLSPKIIKNILDCQDKLIHNVLNEFNEKVSTINELTVSNQEADEETPTH